MAEETVNQETTVETPERTFSQTEVDAIISDRLKREREKYADYADLKTKAGAYDELFKAHGAVFAGKLQKDRKKAKTCRYLLNHPKKLN